jgi:hypothetical protein
VTGDYQDSIPGYAAGWNATNGYPCTASGVPTPNPPFGDGLRVNTLWVASGGTATQLTSYPTKITAAETQDDWPAVSPDGLTLSYGHAGSAAVKNGLRLRTISTGVETVLSTTCSCSMKPPRWSPNGKQILVYTGLMPYGNQIIDSSTGAAIRQIPFSFGGVQGWDWAPRPTS